MREEFKQEFDIAKVNNVKRIVFGKALVPNTFDSQLDYVTPDDIEETAHNFLINIQKAYVELLSGKQETDASQIGMMHTIFKGVGAFGYIVESYIDTDGCWILAVKITDDRIWELVLKRVITGWSVGGKGTRILDEGNDL